MVILRCVLAAGAVLSLSACGSQYGIPRGATELPVASSEAAPEAVNLEEYRIGPRDVLMVSVFNEPDLTFNELPVSSGGTIALPLIGTVGAVGRTSAELGSEIDARLNERYLRNARTAVAVVKATNYTVTVDGAVQKPGIYDIPGRLTLSQSLALAGGGAQFARLNEIIVVREIDGQRHAARFDLNNIRTGREPDIAIRQSDLIIVGFDRAASLFRDVVTSLPSAAAVFVALR